MTPTKAAPLLLIPGPTPVPQPVLEALGRPTQGHNSEIAAVALRAAQTGVLEAVGAPPGDGPLALVLAGSGTLAMEAALVNLVGPGETLLVVNHGFFGHRYAEMARALGVEVVEAACPWGGQVPADQVETALRHSGARVMTVTHVDTATGVVAPVAEYAEIARREGALLVLDSVAGAGGVPVEMARLGVDVVVTASQKAFGGPPGLAILAISEAALEHRRARGRCGSYFLDWLRWEAPMRDPRTSYFATLPTNLVVAAGTAVGLAASEGWEARFDRHRRMGRAVRRSLLAMGLPPMAAEPAASPTVTAFGLPAGVTPAMLRQGTLEFGVAIAGGIGEWSESTGRVGHMGAAGLAELLEGAAAMERALRALGAAVPPGAGVAAVMEGWEEPGG